METAGAFIRGGGRSTSVAAGTMLVAPQATSWGQMRWGPGVHQRLRAGGGGFAGRAGSTSWNPQNTPSPLVLPSAEFTAEEAVNTQLTALMHCDEPWPGHGIQLAYEWGLDIGGMDPSLYFGFPKDLYHEDHFRVSFTTRVASHARTLMGPTALQCRLLQGQFSNQLPELLGARSYEIVSVQRCSDGDAPERWVVNVEVTDRAGVLHNFEFTLGRKQVGSRKGSLMTAMLRKGK